MVRYCTHASIIGEIKRSTAAYYCNFMVVLNVLLIYCTLVIGLLKLCFMNVRLGLYRPCRQKLDIIL